MAEKKTILVVDDDPDIVEAARLVLESAGYAVESAMDGDTALKKAGELIPDLIILDVMMGTTTQGFHVSYKLREDPKTKDIPIVMVSAIEKKTGMKFSPGADREYLPVDDFIAKPVSPEELLKKVKEHLEQG